MMQHTPYNDGLLPIAETAQQCGVSSRTVQRWLAQGELPAVKFGKRTVRIPSAAVRAFIAKNTRVKTPVIAAPVDLPGNKPCAAQRLAEIIRLPVKARIR
jgi:excisionase family DNA binding protein